MARATIDMYVDGLRETLPILMAGCRVIGSAAAPCEGVVRLVIEHPDIPETVGHIMIGAQVSLNFYDCEDPQEVKRRSMN